MTAYLNPRAVEAVGRGSTAVDRAELKARATEAATNGATLVLQGTFLLQGREASASVMPPAGRALHVQARSAVIHQTEPLTPVFALPSGSTWDGGTLRGLGSDWSNQSTVYDATAFRLLPGTTGVTFSGVRGENFAGAGVRVQADCEDVALINCHMRGLGAAVIPPVAGQYGGGVVGSPKGLTVLGGSYHGFPMGLTGGALDGFHIGGGVELSAVGQHGIYYGELRRGNITGARITGAPLDGIKTQISYPTAQDSNGVTIGDVAISGNGSHGIVVGNTQADRTARQRRLTIHDVTVAHAPGSLGDGLRLIYADNVIAHDIQTTGGSRGIQVEQSTNVSVHHALISDTQHSGVEIRDVADADFESIRVIDPARSGGATDVFGFYVHGQSARLGFMHNRVRDTTGNARIGYNIAGGDIATMRFLDNRARGVSEHGYRQHAAGIDPELWLGNDMRGAG